MRRGFELSECLLVTTVCMWWAVVSSCRPVFSQRIYLQSSLVSVSSPTISRSVHVYILSLPWYHQSTFRFYVHVIIVTWNSLTDGRHDPWQFLLPIQNIFVFQISPCIFSVLGISLLMQSESFTCLQTAHYMWPARSLPYLTWDGGDVIGCLWNNVWSSCRRYSCTRSSVRQLHRSLPTCVNPCRRVPRDAIFARPLTEILWSCDAEQQDTESEVFPRLLH